VRARLLLALGAAAGLALAGASLLAGRSARSLPPNAVAVVNGVPIARDDYLRALGAVANDRRAPIDDAVRRRVLDRLIDEELLVQRGTALELVRHDRTVRNALVTGTMELLAGAHAEPSRETLRAFYDAHREYFVDPGRVRVWQVLVRVQSGGDEAAAQARASEAARRLRTGEPVAAVRAALGDEEVAPIPDAPLPATKLREYVGDTAARSVLALDPGATSDPIRSSMGFHVLHVVDRTPQETPPFDGIVDVVRAEYLREADDAALRQALGAMRAAADVRVMDALP